MDTHREDPLEGLNADQRDAVTHEGGPLIVLAGPGTGKTRVITRRIAHLITQRGTDPASILALTFTVRAATEMRERLADLVDLAQAEQVQASTFHGFGLAILRRFGDMLGLPSRITIADSAEQRRALRDAARALPAGVIDIEGADAAADHARALATQIAQLGLEPADVRDRIDRAREAVDADDDLPAAAQHARLDRYAAYTAMIERASADLRRAGRLTLDDLITLPPKLLAEHPAALALVRADARHALVDEYQDSNPAQLAMLRAVCPPEARNGQGPDLVVVGDDDQSIYAFRGADDRAFHHFAQTYPTARTVELTDNYRSAPPVVAATQRTIGNAKPETRFAPGKSLRAAGEHADARPVLAVHLAENNHDADVIAADIAATRASGTTPSTAVIAKTHSDLDRIAAALRVAGIPYRIARRERVLELPAVQDLLAWIETLVDPDVMTPVRRLLVRPPNGVPPDRVAGFHRAYLRAGALAEDSEADPPPSFVGWLAMPPDAAVGGLGRFLRTRDQLVERLAHCSADEMVYEIIVRGGLVAAGMPDTLTLAANASTLAAIVRFTRDVRERLLEPRDLAAFWEHYEDLDEHGRAFGMSEERRIDAIEGEPGEPADPTVVQLLTAHSSKGLEFDTVYVPRIGPAAGYGRVNHSSRDDAPPGVLDELAHDAERQRAEQRRLFYVACTRAQRRLVLLAKRAKTRSKSEHFFQELAIDAPRLADLELVDAADVLAAAARAGVLPASDLGEPDELDLLATRRDVAAEMRDRVRTEAARALAQADDPDVTPDRLAGVRDALAAAAEKLAALALVERSADVPDWVSDDARGLASIVLAAAEDADIDTSALSLPPLPAPLDLSYTRVQDYIDCPRCFYVKHVLRAAGEDSQAASVGTLVHESLATFSRRCRDAEAEGTPPPPVSTLESIAAEHARSALGPTAVPDRDALARARALLRNYAEQLHDPSANILEIEHAAAVPYRAGGHTHTLRVKMDRLEQTDAGLRIVDFKTGTARKALTEPDAKDLQLGIYALAIEHRFPDAAGTAEYWVLDTGQRGVLRLDELRLDKVRDAIDAAIEGMTEGRFQLGPRCRGLCEFLSGMTGEDLRRMDAADEALPDTGPSTETPPEW